MRTSSFAFALLLPVVLLTACEWDTSGTGYNSRYNWVNFNGVYRGVGGGLLITDYTATPGTPGVTNSVTSERIGTQDGAQTAFSGVLARGSVVKGSVSISTAGFTLTDDGSGGLSGGGASGSITYGTGAWSIQLPDGSPTPGAAITAQYQYSVAGAAGSGGAGSGVSGASIYTFVVSHQGENLTITDNNGATYSGSLGSTLVNEGANTADGVAVGDTVVMQYSASGTSAAGKSVRMTGTFQGVVRGGSTQLSLADRRMYGTWDESGGRTGDINGESSPIGITVPTEATTTTTDTPEG